MSGYIGNIPTPQATQTRDVFTATAGQTSFATSGYTPGFLDVYLNGVKLIDGTDFTASNGSDVVLNTGATLDDTLEVIAFTTFEVNSQNFTGNTVIDNVDINGGTIDGTVIGGSNAAAITGTTITGTSFVSSGNMTFGDNDKAIFGAGSDLEIYHDGTDSIIKEGTAGNFLIQGSAIKLQTANGLKDYLVANASAEVTLYYDNAAKLATTNIGVDVTGTIASDGLAVDGTSSLNGDITMNTGTPQFKMFSPSSVNGYEFLANVSDTVDGGLNIRDIAGKKLVQIRSNNDISFYEDTGTTPKFFWDASAERLGIGTTSPASALDVVGDIEVSGGIVFGATGGSVTSKTLDDYEEGTFTPSWGGSATAGTASGTFLGVYTKIGRVVYCIITLSGCNLTGASGALQLTGLPFSAASGYLKSGGTAYLEGVTPSFSYTPQTGSHVQVYVAGSSTTAQFRVGLSAQWDNYLNAASTFTSGGGSTYGTVSITYTT